MTREEVFDIVAWIVAVILIGLLTWEEIQFGRRMDALEERMEETQTQYPE